MMHIQPIEQDGRVVALVVGDRALVDETQLPVDLLPLVQAKCLYALEIQARTLPGPYSEPAATRFAEDVLERVARSRRRAPVIRLPARRSRRVNA
jgi:hypothetical protein